MGIKLCTSKSAAWYSGLLDSSPITFQALQFNSTGIFIEARVFKALYAGEMLTTTEWIEIESLNKCREIQEPGK